MKKVSFKNITSLSRWIMVIGLVAIHYSLFMSEARAQQYLGTDGLIHTPSAEMSPIGTAKVGMHYIDQHMIPDGITLRPEGTKFNSLTNYLSVTPFRWIELSYGYTLWKYHYNRDPNEGTGFYTKDRYFSLRLNLLYETERLPSVVVGGNDVWGSRDEGVSTSNFYRNYYVAATKHLRLDDHELGVHLAFRHWKREQNEKWNGLVGGLTYRPAFYQPLRLIGEYDGDGVNIGVDCQPVKFLILQTSLQKGKYFSGGICFCIGLL